MAKYRRGRINDAVSEELAVAVRELRDPRLIDNFVSITRAEVAADLKVARVYFSALGDDKEAKAALVGACGKLRHHLATTLNLRITPELLFYADNSSEHGANIARILEDIHEDDRRMAGIREKEQAAREAAAAEQEAGHDGES